MKLQNNFIEITLQHGYFPVNLLHIFRTFFPKNTPGGLLLNLILCNQPISEQCSISIHPKYKKHRGFLMFSGGSIIIVRKQLGIALNDLPDLKNTLKCSKKKKNASSNRLIDNVNSIVKFKKCVLGTSTKYIETVIVQNACVSYISERNKNRQCPLISH